MVRRIFSFSLYVLLLTAGARLSFETDALVIGALMGVGSIPFYVGRQQPHRLRDGLRDCHRRGRLADGHEAEHRAGRRISSKRCS